MTWVRLDEEFYQHPKVVQVGPLGIAMQVAGLCYANRNLTDGFVPRAAARTLLDWTVESEGQRFTIARTSGMVGEDMDSEWVIALLLDAGMWEEVEGGYQIHDYSDYQPTKAQVQAEREKKRAAGKAGGEASARARAQANGQAESKPEPVPEPVPEPIKARSKGGGSSSPPVENPGENQPSDVQTYLLGKLGEQNPGWDALTFGAIVKLNGIYGRPAVTQALQRAVEEDDPPKSSGYALIEAMCKDIQKSVPSTGGDRS